MSFALKASAYIRICFTIDSSPLLRVGDKCSLLELRKKYVVYLLSNTNEIHWQWSCLHAFRYKAFRAEDFFEHIYLSYEMKMAKPDADIFQKVLDETGILPNETLFIDDSEANCRTAEALGISTYTPKAHEDWRHAVVL